MVLITSIPGQGLCPPPVMDEPECLEGTTDVCMTDEGCYGETKCCFDGCRKSCQRAIFPNRPKVKLGQCPRPASGLVCDRKGNMCDIDEDCPGSRKCCDNGCQKDCVVPTNTQRGVTKPGICPTQDFIDPKLCNSTTDECSVDGDCFGVKKCCSTGCLMKCLVTPGSTPKPGRCPPVKVTNPDMCESQVDICDFDVRCRDQQKCCFNGCHKECLEPVEKRDKCPKPTKGVCVFMYTCAYDVSACLFVLCVFVCIVSMCCIGGTCVHGRCVCVCV